MNSSRGAPDWVNSACRIHAAGVRGVMPDRLLSYLDPGTILPDGPDGYDRIILAAVGKAGIAFASALEDLLGTDRLTGLAVVPHGYVHSRPAGIRLPSVVQVVEAGHPVPDAAGLWASRRILALADAAGPGDLFIAAVSGGGSALLPALPVGLSLVEVSHTTRLLLASGADIGEVNTVRRALSHVAGGRLASRASGAQVIGLYLSDVPNDDLSVIAGGPTVRSNTGAADAVDVLTRHGLQDRIPASISEFLSRGGLDPALRTGARNVLVGTVDDALRAASDEARAQGYGVVASDVRLTGSAAVVAGFVVAEAERAGGRGPVCLLWGGETTVRVRGGGVGGRNQELALHAAVRMAESRSKGVRVILSAGTDGRDGPTPAAGAWATVDTVSRAERIGLDANRMLGENDSHTYFKVLGDLYTTGPTHTNVMDLVIALVE